MKSNKLSSESSPIRDESNKNSNDQLLTITVEMGNGIEKNINIYKGDTAENVSDIFIKENNLSEDLKPILQLTIMNKMKEVYSNFNSNMSINNLKSNNEEATKKELINDKLFNHIYRNNKSNSSSLNISNEEEEKIFQEEMPSQTLNSSLDVQHKHIRRMSACERLHYLAVAKQRVEQRVRKEIANQGKCCIFNHRFKII